MNTAQLMVLEPLELAKIACAALEKNDEELLTHIDFAFHHIFFQSRKAEEEFKLQLLEALLRAADSVRRELPVAVAARERLFVRWQHLGELVEAFRRDRDRLSDARRLVASRRSALEIVKLLGEEMARGTPGLTVKDLARKVRLSPSGLVPLLDELEEEDIVERHPFGKFVFIQLGLVGQLLSDALRADEKPRTELPTALPEWCKEEYSNAAPMGKVA